MNLVKKLTLKWNFLVKAKRGYLYLIEEFQLIDLVTLTVHFWGFVVKCSQ